MISSYKYRYEKIWLEIIFFSHPILEPQHYKCSFKFFLDTEVYENEHYAEICGESFSFQVKICSWNILFLTIGVSWWIMSWSYKPLYSRLLRKWVYLLHAYCFTLEYTKTRNHANKKYWNLTEKNTDLLGTTRVCYK